MRHLLRVNIPRIDFAPVWFREFWRVPFYLKVEIEMGRYGVRDVYYFGPVGFWFADGVDVYGEEE